VDHEADISIVHCTVTCRFEKQVRSVVRLRGPRPYRSCVHLCCAHVGPSYAWWVLDLASICVVSA